MSQATGRKEGEVNIFVEGGYLENIKAVTRNNPIGCIFIIGNEDINGSIRLKFTAGRKFANIEKLAISLENGKKVWNDTGFTVSSSSIELGRDMTLSSAGSFLETFSLSSPVGHQRALLPHVEFNESGSQGGHEPELSGLVDVVLFSGEVHELISTSISQVINVSDALLLDKGIFKTGTLAAVDPVTLSFYLGTNNTPDPFFVMNYLPEDFPFDQTIELDFEDDFGIDDNQDIFMEFTSNTSFSLRADVGFNIITTFKAHKIVELDTMVSNIILTDTPEGLEFVFEEEANGEFNPVIESSF